jgi:hypothetical protein
LNRSRAPVDGPTAGGAHCPLPKLWAEALYPAKKSFAANVCAKAVYVVLMSHSTAQARRVCRSVHSSAGSTLCSRSRFEAVEPVEKVLDVRGTFLARDIYELHKMARRQGGTFLVCRFPNPVCVSSARCFSALYTKVATKLLHSVTSPLDLLTPGDHAPQGN